MIDGFFDRQQVNRLPVTLLVALKTLFKMHYGDTFVGSDIASLFVGRASRAPTITATALKLILPSWASSGVKV